MFGALAWDTSELENLTFILPVGEYFGYVVFNSLVVTACVS